MRRLLTGALILACGLAALPVRAQALRLAQPNAARFPEIALYAYPSDARGVFINGLTPSAFRVTENGKPASVQRVESAGGYLDLCLALDRSPSMLDEGKLDYARQAAHYFLQQLSPDDRGAVITFASGSTLDQSLTRDRALLLSAVDRAQVSGNTTTFYDAVYWSVAQVALPQGGGSMVAATNGRADARRVVVALTDGLDLSSRVHLPELVQYARANGVSVCTIALGTDAATTELAQLAHETGGLYMPAPNPRDLQRLYATLAEQLKREYRITIASPNPVADGTRRDVRLEIAPASLNGSTWYQAPGLGSTLVTVSRWNGTPTSGAMATGQPNVAMPMSRLILGALLMLAGIASVAGAVVWWMRSRPDSLPMRDSNPRLDLMPLWVREGQTRIGRGDECELVLDSRQVSRVHAWIEAQAGAFQLIDAGSRNGTYVNGHKVRRSRPLRVGDILRFGDREFRFAGELPDSG